MKKVKHLNVRKLFWITLGLALAVGGGLEYRVIAGVQRVTYTNSGISPSVITVTSGEHVKIQITNKASSIHNFVIPDFYIFSSNLSPGQSTTVEFDAVKSGSFPYYSDYSDSGKYGTPEAKYRGTLDIRR